MTDYVNGYIERQQGGQYIGQITVEGISLGKIDAVYFQKDGDSYLWLKRRRVLDFDDKTMSYKEREPQPKWEAYLKKQVDNNTVSYKGEFSFMRFRFSIIGIWDRVFGTDSHRRLNLYVERLPMAQQTVINGINERKRNNAK